MNPSVYFMTLLFLCLDNAAGLICGPLFSKPKPTVQENKRTTDRFSFTNIEPTVPVNEPSTEKPASIHSSEGSEENVDCESTDRYHHWYQGYQNSTSKKLEAIGSIPPQWGITKTRYTIRVESFDDNTVIYCENQKDGTEDADGNSHGTSKEVVWFLNKDLVNEYFKTSIQLDEAQPKIAYETLLYSEKKNTLFSCNQQDEEKNYTYVGVINTTSNIIRTYQTIAEHPRFNKTHNGTILCCLYYHVSETADEKWITRHVTKKTLLVYDDTVRQDTLESDEIISADTETGQTGNQATTINITTAVVGVLLLLVSIVVCKKRCRKKPISDSKVLYVDLDLRRNAQPESISSPGPEEESPYAQIIGVLKPDQ